ncbi:I78 family peptidase inhibitor [Allosphingosinicella humi]|jgi:hypothetical protein
MTTKLTIACLALGTAACTTMAADAPPAMGPDKCDALRAQGLIGRPASAELAAEAQRLSGAEMVRWLQPGQVVTMEYRHGRLNIVLDKDNRVESINCG